LRRQARAGLEASRGDFAIGGVVADLNQHVGKGAKLDPGVSDLRELLFPPTCEGVELTTNSARVSRSAVSVIEIGGPRGEKRTSTAPRSSEGSDGSLIV